MCSVDVSRNYDLLNNIMRRVKDNSNRDFIPIRPDSVRRVLFGAPLDHNATSRDLNRHLEEIEVEARTRWNFDFGSDNPLQGRYQWQPVSARGPTASNPETRPRPSPSSSPELGPTASASSQGHGGRTQGNSQKSEPVVKVSPTPRKATVQTKMTDFASQRKRPSTLLLNKSPTSSSIQKALFPSQPMAKLRRTSTTDVAGCSSSAVPARPSPAKKSSSPT